MKKTNLTLIALTLLLTACAGKQPASGAAAIPARETLSASAQLILGTLRLEGTVGAVTAEQAAELLPFWQVYQELEGSGTAAQEEIDALIDEVQETMTHEQLASIQAMGLTQADVTAVMSEQELVAISSQASSGVTTSSSGPQGGPGGGMPPGEMAADPGTLGAAPISTLGSSSESSQSQAQANAAVPSALLDALIALLQSRMG